jgi:hypothetical protein
MLIIVKLIFGFGLLLFGRRLFWLFVAAAGFFAGVELTTRFWNGPEWLAIVVGFGLGILFAILAVALKSFAIGLAGFLLGGSTVLSLAATFGIERGAVVWVLYIVGGILGIALISAFFDWALIGISTFAGASMIAQSLDINRPVAGIVILILLIIGIVAQFEQKRKEMKRDD